MLRTNITYLILLLITVKSFAGEDDSLRHILDKTIDNQAFYTEKKEQRIENLKQLFSVGGLTVRQQYDIHNKLYDEYRKYQTDSATTYVQKNKVIAEALADSELLPETNLKLAYLYSARGMYIEAKNLLDSISKNRLPDRLLPDYYEIYGTFCSGYGQSNNNIAYYQESEKYRDSLLSILDTESLQYKIAYAADLLYGNQGGKDLLLELMNGTDASSPERGVIAYYLGYLYERENNTDSAEIYYMISAIADVENCIRDNASLRALSLLYYASGNIDKAHRFMKIAIDDALACNLPYRTVEISASYPIISVAYQEKESKSKTNLLILLLIISLLLIIVFISLLYIYKQMQRLARIKNELSETNLRLSELNSELSDTNSNLAESNVVKEEYIGHFFDLCSSYIDKMENYRKSLNKFATNKQMEDLHKMLRSTQLVDNEVEELYNKFDVIFLNLYPSFVEEFNALQTPGEQVLLKKGELMNTELRIFALIRLGIADSVKIASFLRYSISTIYNYRVKARNNATVPREQFEGYIMKIGVKK
ncbi:MAG: DUF6377 domain-containing protein [Tannerella sp.]|jgi:competence protein ComGC|nr:DUF6377 domain-containing protein [Tannerella sp.]